MALRCAQGGSNAGSAPVCGPDQDDQVAEGQPNAARWGVLVGTRGLLFG